MVWRKRCFGVLCKPWFGANRAAAAAAAKQQQQRNIETAMGTEKQEFIPRRGGPQKSRPPVSFRAKLSVLLEPREVTDD